MVKFIGLFTVLILTACTVTFTPEAGPPPSASNGIAVTPLPDSQTDLVNSYLLLTAYPGSEIISRSLESRDSEVTFRVNASLQQVYQHLHNQLLQLGFRRTKLEVEADEIEATYRRGSLEVELELEYEGNNLFELEIDIDD